MRAPRLLLACAFLVSCSDEVRTEYCPVEAEGEPCRMFADAPYVGTCGSGRCCWSCAKLGEDGAACPAFVDADQSIVAGVCAGDLCVPKSDAETGTSTLCMQPNY